MAESTPPPRPWREEARTESVKCPSCGGPIALHGFHAATQVACPFCGSVLRPEDSGALTILVRTARARRPSLLPLHARGVLDGTEWEVLGICHRACVVDGVTYPWQEFLLYNPWAGFRWLIYGESDHHWALGVALAGAPRIVGKKHHSVEWRRRRYKHFQHATAQVTYVEGEFPWEVRAGDRAEVDDFVAPPAAISIEQPIGQDGVELSRTLQRHVPAREVWAAFGLPGKPPKPRAIGSLEPNTWRTQRRSMWLSCAALLALWWAASAYVQSQCREREVIVRTDLPFGSPLAEELTIGQPGETTTVEVSFTAAPLDNSWAFAEVMLVNLETEQAFALGLEASWYHGFEGGESWSEGDLQPDAILGGVPGGRYLLQVTPERDTLGDGDFVFGVRSPEQWSLRVREDVYLTRYAILALIVIVVFPLLGGLMSLRFEKKRWYNSDYG